MVLRQSFSWLWSGFEPGFSSHVSEAALPGVRRRLAPACDIVLPAMMPERHLVAENMLVWSGSCLCEVCRSESQNGYGQSCDCLYRETRGWCGV